MTEIIIWNALRVNLLIMFSSFSTLYFRMILWPSTIKVKTMPYRYGKWKSPLCAVVIINNKKYLCQNKRGKRTDATFYVHYDSHRIKQNLNSCVEKNPC